MTDVKWIKLATDLFENEKVLLLDTEEDADSLLLLWVKLLCLAGKQNNHGMFVLENGKVYTPEMFATVLRRDVAVTKRALQLFVEYSMLTEEDGILCIKNWDEYQALDALERKREVARLASQKYRDRKKERNLEEECNRDDDGDITVMSRHAADKIREDKNRGDKSREDQIREDKKREEYTGEEIKEKSKKKKFSFSEFAGSSAELLEALEAFETMRKAIRKPMTDRAKEMLCTELRKYPESEWVPMLNQAVLNSWQSVYPLKKTGPGCGGKAASELDDFYAMTADWAGGKNNDGQ